MELKIVRKIDNLGRIVIPKDIRLFLALNTGDEISIEVKCGNVILAKNGENANEKTI